MKKVVESLFLIIIVLFSQTMVVFAHPGRTDSNGCHTCRTNCASWGLSTGQYHCHNGGSSNSRSYSTTTRRTTTIREVYGCTDKSAINYNSSANVSDGSCQYEKIETVKRSIYYSTETKGNLTSGEKEIIREGKNGEKEVTIKKIVGESGNEISSETINETVTIEPVNEVVEYHPKKAETKISQDKKEESSNTPLIVAIIVLIINIFYGNKNKDSNLIINKIKNVNSWIKYVLYFLYFIFIIPVFIDIVLVIVDLFNKNRN